MLIDDYELEVFTPPCDPGAPRFAAKAHLKADIRGVLPYLNAILAGAEYNPAAPWLRWRKADHTIVFHPLEIAAGNLVALAAWCSQYGMRVSSAVARDQLDQLQEALGTLHASHDAILTSGGAWKGDRDLIVHALDNMGWQKMYHRVRIGPGKAVGFGVLEGKPVFCLPGGPPSNQMAFLQLALPGLLKMSGYGAPSLPLIPVRMAEELCGQIDWTQFVYGNLRQEDGQLVFQKVDMKSRLQMMALADAIVSIPESCDHLAAGSICQAQLLSRSPAGFHPSDSGHTSWA